MNNLNRKATPWVSYFVLVGCLCITAVLVYVSQQALAIGDDWDTSQRVADYIHN